MAEVLVTLGIIGVVSAMTLPTLVKNHQRQVYVTQLQKVYNELSQAFEQVITDSNAVNLSESKFEHKGAEWFIKNYFKTTKICSGNATLECFADEYKNLNGSTIRLRNFVGVSSQNKEVGISAILTNGASISISNRSLVVDVNGKSGPNILGRDFFDLGFATDDGSIKINGNIEDVASNFTTNCASSTDTIAEYGGCFSKILNDGWKMDY